MHMKTHTLKNGNGMEAAISEYGGTLVSLFVPGRDGGADVVMGFDTREEYEAKSPYFGALIGRFGNRIANGRFSLDGTEYSLATNNGRNHLHGGNRGFDKVAWEGRRVDAGGDDALELAYESADGEEGYPGALKVTATYALTADNELSITYRATTDKPTVLNLTNHSYWNLAGHGSGPMLGHVLELFADAFTPVDETLIPTGEIRPVDGTPFDFRTPAAIGERIGADDEQLRRGGGYDHNFVKRAGSDLVARVTDPSSGRTMTVRSDQPGVQLYSGNFLPGDGEPLVGKGGAEYRYRGAFCLETQHFPDSPNRPEFPSTALRPGEEFLSRTSYGFSW